MWVEWLTHITGLEVKVRSGRTPRGTAVTDEFSCGHDIAAIDDVFAKVSIVGLKSIGMTDDEDISITAGVAGWKSHADDTVKGGIDWVT